LWRVRDGDIDNVAVPIAAYIASAETHRVSTQIAVIDIIVERALFYQSFPKILLCSAMFEDNRVAQIAMVVKAVLSKILDILWRSWATEIVLCECLGHLVSDLVRVSSS
jgi:hypothetical protein